MKILLGIAVCIALITIGIGVTIFVKKTKWKKQNFKNPVRISVGSFGAVLLAAIALLIPDMIFAAEATGTSAASSASGLGYIAAALSTGMATIGAGYAVGAVGSSALGAVSEDPKILGKTLIFVGLAEGIAIYGLIISILILGNL